MAARPNVNVPVDTGEQDGPFRPREVIPVYCHRT
jgi:hypothetical protein